MNPCPRCGASTSPDLTVCRACGQPLVHGASPWGAAPAHWPASGVTAQANGAGQATPNLPPTMVPVVAPTSVMPPAPHAAWGSMQGGPQPPYAPPPYAPPYAPPPHTPAPPGGSRLPLLAAFAAGVLATGLGAAFYVRSARDAAPTAPPATARDASQRAPTTRPQSPDAPPPTGDPSTVGAPPMPQPPAAAPVSFAMAILHFSASVDEPSAALGQPDHRSAIVRAGMLTLQMPTEQQLISDGTPAADVRVEVAPEMPGPYRVEIGVGHNQFVVVADGVRGSQALDIDAAGVRIGRFVRLSTRASGASVAIDAVLVRVPPAVAPSN